MSKKQRGIYVKVFGYTLIFLVLVIVVTMAVFAQQFLSMYQTMQSRQIAEVFKPVILQFAGRTPGEIAGIAGEFAAKNETFRFEIANVDGDIIYSSGTEATRVRISPAVPPAVPPNAPPDMPPDAPLFMYGESVSIAGGAAGGAASAPASAEMHVEMRFKVSTGWNDTTYTLNGSGPPLLNIDYHDLVDRSLLALGIMLGIGALAAVLFSRQITRPIRKLTYETHRMANLEEVSPPPARNDELGQLEQDVYTMYGSLKKTIARLEEEIKQVQELEEHQRSFFSAASHELKTPIAATNALVEGMLANIGDYKDHPKYLRECLRMLDSQNRLVSEILEIVNFSNGKAAMVPAALLLAELVDSLLAGYLPLAKQKGQSFSVDIPRACTFWCGDRNLLRRALSNIIANAVQNSPEHECIRIWTEKTAGRAAGRAAGRDRALLRLNILNTNAHIRDEDLGRLFEPFYRSDPARSRPSLGTPSLGTLSQAAAFGAPSGLGLSIVKTALDRMGISFALENTPEGVCFWMDLEELPQ